MFALQTVRRYLWLAILPAAWAAFLLLARFWFELQGTLHDDVHTYLAVGRGILNGLTPYVDLFESKPPGIFLLAATSVKLTGGAGLLKFLTAMAVLVIPLSTVAIVWEVLKGRDNANRILWIALSFVFSTIMTLYALQEAGEGLVEPLGAAMCMVFAVVFVRTQQRVRLKNAFLVGLPILLAVGLKEPFLFVLTAQALLLKRDWRHFHNAFLIPLLVAIILGVTSLAILGYLGPYFTVYVKHMLGFHLNQLEDQSGPFLLRGLMIQKTLWHLWDYSLPLVILFVGIIVGTFGSTLRLATRMAAPGMVLAYLLSLYLILLAIGTGGDFFAHHFVFGTAGWIAVWVVFVREMQSFGGRHWSNAVRVIALILFTATLSWHRSPTFGEALNDWNARYAVLRNAASTIDTVMDRCGWERYLHITNKGGGVFGFTRHSPYGPIFIQFNRFIDGNPMYRERFKQSLLETPLMILRSDRPTNLTDVAKAYINENFSFTPPQCAGEFTQPEPYRLVFRKSSSQ